MMVTTLTITILAAMQRVDLTTPFIQLALQVETTAEILSATIIFSIFSTKA